MAVADGAISTVFHCRHADFRIMAGRQARQLRRALPSAWRAAGRLYLHHRAAWLPAQAF